jgi:hypothetical protein
MAAAGMSVARILGQLGDQLREVHTGLRRVGAQPLSTSMLSSVRSVTADHLPGGQPDAGRVGEAALRLLDDLQHQPAAWPVAAGSAGGPGDHLDGGVGDVLRDRGDVPVYRCVMRCARQGLVICSPDCTLSEVETCRSSELQTPLLAGQIFGPPSVQHDPR